MKAMPSPTHGDKDILMCTLTGIYSKKDREKSGKSTWKEFWIEFWIEEKEWDQNMKAELVEGPVERVSQEKVVKAIT